MLTKAIPATYVKAGEADGLEANQFEALVSVMNVKDSTGDVVIPGAFDESLAEWAASGNPMPIIWSHGYFDATNHIGFALEAEQRTIGDKTGLWIKGQLDSGDGVEDAQARKAAALLRGKRVTQFSFSYDILDGAMAKSAEFGDYFELRKLKIYESGPTLIGANQDTELIAAKAARDLAVQMKAGKVLSAANEGAIRAAVESLQSVLASVSSSDDGKARTDPLGNAEDRSTKSDNAEDLAAFVSADALELEIELASI